jgi:hypothetical protein
MRLQPLDTEEARLSEECGQGCIDLQGTSIPLKGLERHGTALRIVKNSFRERNADFPYLSFFREYGVGFTV